MRLTHPFAIMLSWNTKGRDGHFSRCRTSPSSVSVAKASSPSLTANSTPTTSGFFAQTSASTRWTA